MSVHSYCSLSNSLACIFLLGPRNRNSSLCDSCRRFLLWSLLLLWLRFSFLITYLSHLSLNYPNWNFLLLSWLLSLFLLLYSWNRYCSRCSSCLSFCRHLWVSLTLLTSIHCYCSLRSPLSCIIFLGSRNRYCSLCDAC